MGPVLRIVFVDVSLVGHEDPQPILELLVLLHHIERAPVELDHDLGPVDHSSLVIAFEGTLALSVMKNWHVKERGFA